jgi:hypothetical protein
VLGMYGATSSFGDGTTRAAPAVPGHGSRIWRRD